MIFLFNKTTLKQNEVGKTGSIVAAKCRMPKKGPPYDEAEGF